MTHDNGRSQEAQRVREESEFIKRIEDFARYMAPEYITDSDNPRSLMIIAADCLDAKEGRHAMAHIMVGNDRVGRCALRSMMEDNDTFSSLVHELCDDDGGSRPVEELDEEIGRRQKRQRNLYIISAVAAVWTLVLVALLITGISDRLMAASSIFMMLAVFATLYGQIRPLRSELARLRQQRKRAAGRQKIVSRISQFADFLRQMRNQLEEDAGDDDED